MNQGISQPQSPGSLLREVRAAQQGLEAEVGAQAAEPRSTLRNSSNIVGNLH